MSKIQAKDLVDEGWNSIPTQRPQALVSERKMQRARERARVLRIVCPSRP